MKTCVIRKIFDDAAYLKEDEQTVNEKMPTINKDLTSNNLSLKIIVSITNLHQQV